ncbi:hypothetical protein [Silanimonas sp.]|jgi:hypothetical protein|uniref:hypothetical protein n=1 Tax=Silanimonas sp. TaxID=1929290 RepID=UPI0022C660EA|nr:hypothetical protein [Silanimonas sp.]MCZ8063996.1 hypothetical protein [Silanimonas sp.]
MDRTDPKAPAAAQDPAKRITRSLRLESALWAQLNQQAAEASIQLGRRISVNGLVRRALIDQLKLTPPDAPPEAGD